MLFNCDNVFIEAKSYPTFPDVTVTEPIDGREEFHPAHRAIAPAAGGDIVVVRMFYQWPLFVTGLGYNISNLAGSKRLLSATAAFRNEPFLATAPC